MAASQAEDISGSTRNMVRIRIQGLERSMPITFRSSTSSEVATALDTSEETITLPGDTPISALWDKLRELGYKGPDSLSRNNKMWKPNCYKPQFKEFEQITVTQDYWSEPGKSIHTDDRLIAYSNRHFGSPIELNIDDNDWNAYGIKVDSLKDSGGLEIIFHRTVRMPDDDRLHQLPGSLGAFPLYSVVAYSDKLPEEIVQAGGVFMPMWQREALWMSFDAPHYAHYALRFSVGRINAISGLRMNETKEVSAQVEGSQDYVVVPGQEWLDGICVAPGIVRQFVAMPLGSGYTVEGQKTGKEKHGGLQIEIIPSFKKDLRTWIKDSDASLSITEVRQRLSHIRLDEFKTPRELGLGVGDKIRLYPQEAFELVPFTLIDMIEEDGTDGDSASSIIRGELAAAEHLTELDIDDDEGDRRYGRRERPPNQLSQSLNFDLLLTSQAPVCTETQAQAKQAEVEREDVKAMGIAAGGKLIQDIYQDRNPARIWNTEAAKLVHVHILDPASCEAVTHIVPPPPPVDAMGYIEQGGSFFVVEEQTENRVHGGDFDNVKSVSGMDRDQGVRTEPSLDPTQATQCKCGIRFCDCVVRPCDHQFCNVCIREVDPSSLTFTSAEPQSRAKWFCPTCKAPVSYVAGFSAPMNLPGEESVKIRVPVNVLEVKDGRVAFKSIQQSRV